MVMRFIMLHLVENPESLWWAMISFTIIKGIVGLFVMLCLFTRLMSIGVFSLAMRILFLTLFTNQYFYGGIWGTLHNKSVKPIVEISKAELTNDLLTFEVFRVEEVDVYGSFLIGIDVF